MEKYDLKVGMRVAITGSTGYIGARLQHYLQHKHEVLPIMRSGGKGYSSFNLSQPRTLRQTLHPLDVDVIVHAAAIARREQCTDNPKIAHLVNVESTKVIAEWANQRGIHLIFLSSLSIYEDNIYAKTKRLAEQVIFESGVINTILGLAYTFGYSPSCSRPKPMQRLELEAQYPGSISFDDSWQFQPTSIEHVCYIMQAIIENNMPSGKVNVVTTEATTMFEIASTCLPHQVQACKNLIGRHEHFIPKTHLSDFKLPECSISSLFEEVRDVLQTYCTIHR